ncbi:hypothetical protein N7523_002377 [Penicillium sp. IBT 18751x]|nr:hypothetical protein N7523_002377 [Penicillium sp. IBT 18751x]
MNTEARCLFPKSKFQYRADRTVPDIIVGWHPTPLVQDLVMIRIISAWHCNPPREGKGLHDGTGAAPPTRAPGKRNYRTPTLVETR